MEKLSKKEKIFLIIRSILILLVFALAVFITVKVIPIISNLSDESYRVEFKNKISQMGFKGVLMVLGLQILQIVVAIIPGQPMEIVSGMLYGTWGGMILCLSGIFLGTAIVYFMVRRIGTDFMQLFFSKEQIDGLKNSKIFKNPAKLEILMFTMFVIPLVPKDIFIYLGGISPIKPKKFLIMATITRIPGLFFTVYAGNKLSEGSFFVTLILIAIVVVIGIIGLEISNREKDKLENDDVNN